LKNSYQRLFRSGLPLEEVLAELAQTQDENVAHLVSFIRASQRGFTRAGTKEVKTGEQEQTAASRSRL
jgi:hypothetical protein